MAFERGGRADKGGNRFEYNWAVSKLLEVLMEKIDYVLIEAVGDDEKGIDLWVGRKDGVREGQQCKARNASQESWDYGSIHARGIIENWKLQLTRNSRNTVSLVSPLAFTLLEDLTNMARNTSGSPEDFLKFQIQGSGVKTQQFFKNMLTGFGLDADNGQELAKGIHYLSRIYYRQNADTEFRNDILWQIGMLFIGDPEQIYDEFLSFLLNRDIWGQKIDAQMLDAYCKERNIVYKFLDKDERILPRIHELNEEYRNNYRYFHSGLYERKESAQCIQAVLRGDSVVIHGRAGSGKSGCTENIIQYCEKHNLLYLAVKLDKRIPHSTSELWAASMGLPSSVVSCLHSFSRDKKAVLILDQLDALRWTQAHSGNALDVCLQIIRETEKINRMRSEKISIIFVCRTYDLENDNNIRNLFQEDKKSPHSLRWIKVPVLNLTDVEITGILGEKSSALSPKLRDLVKIPGNLYILEQLDLEKCLSPISTTHDLITTWWKQLLQKAGSSALSEQMLETVKDNIIEFCETRGRIYAPLTILKAGQTPLEFLQSNGFLLIQDGKASFVHQSILNCFLCEHMMAKYYRSECIDRLIGDLQKQTPGKRYQVQMFLQQLLEISVEDFMDAGKQLLASPKIRYHIKYVFLEILSQIDVLSDRICEFITEYLDSEEWGSHVLNHVIMGKKPYVNLLRDTGIIDAWMNDSPKRSQAIRLLTSVSHQFSKEDVLFIRKYIFENEQEAGMWSNCFLDDIDTDIDELFELRMEFYQTYPDLSYYYLDFEEMMAHCPFRMVRLLTFRLKDQKNANCQDENLYSHEEDLLYEKNADFIIHCKEIIALLLPCLPAKEERTRYSNWSGRFPYQDGLERTCIDILKKANHVLAEKNPVEFWLTYDSYFGSGNDLYNEIILDALTCFPTDYADMVIEYLYSDFDKTVFENTSGAESSVRLAQKVIDRFAGYCSEKVYHNLEQKIIHYLHPHRIPYYRERLEYNRSHRGESAVYWRFWGDFQRDMLSVLSENRMSREARELLRILERAYGRQKSLYRSPSTHSGFVTSAISGKNLAPSDWKGILTSQKLKQRGSESGRWIETNGGFIENTTQSFADAFLHTVSERPQEMLLLVLTLDKNIDPLFVNALYSGIAYSEKLKDMDQILLEQLFARFPCTSDASNAQAFCRIIRERKNTYWSQVWLETLKTLALCFEEPVGEPTVVSPEQDGHITVEELENTVCNTVCGTAIQTIGRLITDHASLYEEYKDVIAKLCMDEALTTRYASLYALYPAYHMDREWAGGQILRLYKTDIRLVGFSNSRPMLFHLYPRCRDAVMEIIWKCYSSDDKHLIQVGAFTLTEMYLRKDEFSEIIFAPDKMNKEQAAAVWKMSAFYFNMEEYNRKATHIFTKLLEYGLHTDIPWERLFYDKSVNMERDSEFLLKLISSKTGENVLHAFVRYLEKEHVTVLTYGDLILEMCSSLVSQTPANIRQLRRISRELSRLIISLYDETSNAQSERGRQLANRCLDIWDLMYKNQIGDVQVLTDKMMEL